MKTGVFITARLGSTRLKNKHLLPVNDKPLIVHLISRIHAEFKDEISREKIKIAIATSDEPENRLFEALGADVFFGSIQNIPLRHFQAAKSLGVDAIVSVDGDDILCSPNAMRLTYEALASGAVIAGTSDLPFGMNAWGYSREFLETSIANHQKAILETGWGRVFDMVQKVDLKTDLNVTDERLRFTLDYEDDYHFFKALIESLGGDVPTATDRQIVDVALNKRLYLLNESIAQEYWSNFYKQQSSEKLASSQQP